MSQIIAVHSFRGGTGKSNTTANLAAYAARTGKRVGIIDTDIQSPGIHVIFAIDHDKLTFALNDFLWGRCRIEQAACDVTHTIVTENQTLPERAKLFLIPSSVKTGEIAKVLREGYDVGLLNDGIHALARELNLDYLFIDTHPGVNEETLLSIAICNKFVLIMRPDNQDFQGTAVTVEIAKRLDVQDILLIVNKVPHALNQAMLREQIESAFQIPIVGMLPLNSEMASLASSGLFTQRFPDHPLSRDLNAIAARLIG
jgi:MinD-like ATPase involved in chromosome partitioning or flagellar assembly